MARLTRCFLLSIFILAQLNGTVRAGILTKEWIPLPRDCLNTMLSDIAGNKKLIPEERVKLEGAAYHNDQIFKKFSEIPEAHWEDELNKTIDHYAAYDLDFHAPSFKQWLKESQVKLDPKSTMGKYLQDQNAAFVKKYPKGKIENVVNDLAEDIKKVAKECKGDLACNEQKVAAVMEKNQSKLCFMKKENRKSALKSMITGIAFANAGYAMTTAQDPQHDYPYDLTLNNLIWTPIITEMGCRSTLGTGSIGSKIELNKPIYASKEWWTRAGNKYISYMILSPISNASYVAFHTGKQLIQNKIEWKDVSMWDLSKQVASLSLWDAVYPVPRMVMVTDPLYLKGVPGFNKYLSSKWSSKGAVAPTYALDWGSRLGLSYLNSKWVNWWVGKSDEWWDTGFSGKAKPTPGATTLQHGGSVSSEVPKNADDEYRDTIPNFK